MPNLKQKNFETFNSGILNVYKMKNRKKQGIILENLRFGDKTVGIKTYFDARIIADQIDRKIAVPCIGKIGKLDLVEIGDKQYTISQIQEKFDARPPCSYLILKEEKVKINADKSGGID